MGGIPKQAVAAKVGRTVLTGFKMTGRTLRKANEVSRAGVSHATGTKNYGKRVSSAGERLLRALNSLSVALEARDSEISRLRLENEALRRQIALLSGEVHNA